VSGRYSARSVELEERVETEDRPNDPPHAGTATSTPRSEGGLDMGWVTGCGVASRRLMGTGLHPGSPRPVRRIVDGPLAVSKPARSIVCKCRAIRYNQSLDSAS